MITSILGYLFGKKTDSVFEATGAIICFELLLILIFGLMGYQKIILILALELSIGFLVSGLISGAFFNPRH